MGTSLAVNGSQATTTSTGTPTGSGPVFSPPVFSREDTAFMRAALRLAERAVGNSWPNPAVGCVLARGNNVLGRGWTQPGGRPHAETRALDDAAGRHGAGAARGATAYVSLEPCAHDGKTPPCTDALLAAGVARVAVACRDPDPRVDGGGIGRLREAGVEVAEGLLEPQARELNAGFFMRVETGRPLVTLKTATSLDGGIATAAGRSKWITGQKARTRGHLLRAKHDAVLVGIGTALADDPMLDCRLPRFARFSPVRVVVDTNLRLPADSQLVRTADRLPTWVLTGERFPDDRARAIRQAGVDVIPVPAGNGGLDMAAALRAVAGRGITRLMVEGGGAIATSLLRSDLIDRIVWFRAPILLGSDARPAIAALAVDDIDKAPRFRCVGHRRLGDDLMDTYSRIAA